MKVALWCVGIGLSLCLLDLAAGLYLDWQRRRTARLRAEAMWRYGMTSSRDAYRDEPGVTKQ